MAAGGWTSPSRFRVTGEPAEWSALPTLSETDIKEDTSVVCNEFGGMSLDIQKDEDDDDSNTKRYCAVSAFTFTRNMGRPSECINTKSKVSEQVEQFSPLAKSRLTPHPGHYRQKHERSASGQIPTALVTPLPGTNPLQQRSNTHEDVSVAQELEGSTDKKMAFQHTMIENLSALDDGTLDLFERWKGLLHMKDVLVKQKNLQIERQKGIISKLQQEMSELESALQQRLLNDIDYQSKSVLQARVQAVEAENSFLKAELNGVLTSQSKDSSKLSNKLDLKEYELSQALVVHEQTLLKSQELILSLENEIGRLRKRVTELEEKLVCSDAAIGTHVEQLDRLTVYMRSMPSVEEHQALLNQNERMRVQCETLAKDLEEMKASLKHFQEIDNTKDILVQSYESTQEELAEARLCVEEKKGILATIEVENKKLKEQYQTLQKVLAEADRRCRQELQAMRERHRTRFVEATAKLRNQYKTLAKRARTLESQLKKNSDAMIALNSELQTSQGTIGALKTSVKELVHQNQGLLEQNLSLQESTAEAMRVSSSVSEAQSTAAQRLSVELSKCTEELDSLIILSMSILKGQEPSSAMLFGYDRNTFLFDDDLAEIEMESWLAQVKCHRQKIDELRSTVSENFASQLASVCNVQ